MKHIQLIALMVFIACNINAENRIKAYEYWFDNDYASKVSTAVSPIKQFTLNANVSTVGLANGIHTINIRAMDNANTYSSVLSQFFYKMPQNVASTHNLTTYEYWFDNDYAHAVKVNTSVQKQVSINELIKTQNLTDGIHTLNIRFKDNAQQWSSTLSQFFYKMPQNVASAHNLITYEYWFDNDYANVVKVNTPAQKQVSINELIKTQSLIDGVHTLNIRFKDNAQQWSSTLSQFFYKMPQNVASAHNLITYEYWFDNDYANAVKVNTSAQKQVSINELIKTQTLTDGIHTLNIRFKDNAQVWSSTLSHFFYKMSITTITHNAISNYRYWLDNDFDNACHISLTNASKHLILDQNIDLKCITKGKHSIHFQFKDSLGLWSSVSSDSIFSTVSTIDEIDSSVTKDGITLEANQTGATYQWLDCSNENLAIAGANGQRFTATANGNYAVEITVGSCTKTSDCNEVTTVGILENTYENSITVFPNPTNGLFKVNFAEVIIEFKVTINDIKGELISQSVYKNTNSFEMNLNAASGIYFLTINSGDKKAIIKLIKY